MPYAFEVLSNSNWAYARYYGTLLSSSTLTIGSHTYLQTLRELFGRVPSLITLI